MHGEKKHFGEIFVTRRKEMNLGLKEVENALSIRMNYLQAIEDGQLGKLISPVHAQGFIRQYATFLGLDADAVMKDYMQSFQVPMAKQDFSYGIGTMEARGTQSGGVKWLPNVMWVVFSVVVILAAWFLARYLELI
ncbi:MAG: helix-turn-helix domain-containing protein [Chlamydiales bacterium]|nr:helix-turn-helix domain-containing protein [Chlamydiales bacterium]